MSSKKESAIWFSFFGGFVFFRKDFFAFGKLKYQSYRDFKRVDFTVKGINYRSNLQIQNENGSNSKYSPSMQMNLKS